MQVGPYGSAGRGAGHGEGRECSSRRHEPRDGSADLGPRTARVAALAQKAAKDSNLSTLWDEEKRRFAMM